MKNILKVSVMLAGYILLLVAVCLSIYNTGRISKLERNIKIESAARSFMIGSIVSEEENPFNRMVVINDTVFFYKDDVFVGSSVFSTK